MDEISRITSLFLSKPYTMKMGAAKLAEWWKTDDTIVRMCRDAIREKEFTTGSMPKILVFDIETSPLKAFVYQKSVWRSNISDEKVLSEWFMLSWAAKFINEDNVMSDRLSSKEALDEDDSRIAKSLWKLLDDADIVVTHNGDNFDIPNINTRFLLHGLNPPSPYQSIDTNRIAKRQFGFTHNSMNGIAKVFGFEPKLETNFQLWKDCVAGKEEALMYMEKYNRYDVELLEMVYTKLRPWIKGHPNVGLFMESEEPICPNCGHNDLELTGKYYYTSVSKFETLRCNKCGALARMRHNEFPKDKRKNLIVSTYR